MFDEEMIYEVLQEREHELFDEMLEKYRADHDYHWPTVEPGLISAVWEHYSRTGLVVDDGRFERILNDIRDNILRLRISTTLAGHMQVGPEEVYEIEPSEFFYQIFAWIEDTAPRTTY